MNAKIALNYNLRAYCFQSNNSAGNNATGLFIPVTIFWTSPIKIYDGFSFLSVTCSATLPEIRPEFSTTPNTFAILFIVWPSSLIINHRTHHEFETQTKIITRQDERRRENTTVLCFLYFLAGVVIWLRFSAWQLWHFDTLIEDPSCGHLFRFWRLSSAISVAKGRMYFKGFLQAGSYMANKIWRYIDSLISSAASAHCSRKKWCPTDAH